MLNLKCKQKQNVLTTSREKQLHQDLTTSLANWFRAMIFSDLSESNLTMPSPSSIFISVPVLPLLVPLIHLT